MADATRIDKNNRFWVINYFFPGDRKVLKPSNDILASKYGNGPSHSRSKRVERLIESEIKNLGDEKFLYLAIEDQGPGINKNLIDIFVPKGCRIL